MEISTSKMPEHKPLPFWHRVVLCLFYWALGLKVILTGQIQTIRWTDSDKEGK